MTYTMRDTAEFLFKLLDDIDTVGDMAKGDDAAYRKMVHRIQRRRFEVADTDGHRVAFVLAGDAPLTPDSVPSPAPRCTTE